MIHQVQNELVLDNMLTDKHILLVFSCGLFLNDI